jgi:hypothetical protein
MNTGIIILGMPRSGTSLVAHMVQTWGAYGGANDDFRAADTWNPKGYWEYGPLRRFNKELLASIGTNERVPPDDDRPLKQKASEPEYRARALQLIATMQAGGAAWFWKDPLLSIALPFWNKIWKDAVFIIPVRDPYDSALSQQKMFEQKAGKRLPLASFPLSAVLLYWQCYMLSALRNTESSRRKIFVEYEKLIQAPLKESRRLCRFLDAQFNTQPRDEQTTAAMASVVDPNLRRNRGSRPFASLPLATPEQKKLYRFLRGKVASPFEPFRPADFALYPGWKDYLQSLDILFQLSNDGGQL